ncbi:MAG: serine/threonine protein kinase [Aridibacter famidurans]|nr:serine/threonine protein kinase [Aridibacter famidurans]
MTEDRNWELIERLAFEALSRSGQERLDYLERELAGHPRLREPVLSLIEHEAEADEFFDSPAAVRFATLLGDEGPEADPGQLIGKYRVIRELGVGGMGAVYKAERVDGEIRQVVAIKLLRREFNTAEIRKRFEREIRIQAALDHPGIARMIDSGTTGDGIPYLALEFIEGSSIVDYCEKDALPLRERLKLFNKVCDAVAFAHRNLVVHRDLKPSNILVTAEGEPKLLDFGISKLLSDTGEETHTITRMGVMTPEYASPEQVTGKSVSTSTDVYSLGVILYEILTGERPFRLGDGGENAVLRDVLETEPERPSGVAERRLLHGPRSASANGTARRDGEHGEPETRESGNADTAEHEPVTVRLSCAASPKQLRGDLDNIVLKALRKEPERRYRTVDQLSTDIWNHLDGLPVSARPATLGYKASKFVSRHRTGVALGFVIVLLIVAGVVAALWQARIANAEAERAKKTSEFLQRILNFSNPSWISSNPEQDRNVTLSSALDEALNRIGTELEGEPEIQADIQFTLGKSFVYQGRTDRAEEILLSAIEKYDSVYGEPNVNSMRASVVLADCKYLDGELDQAEKLYKSAIEYFRPIHTAKGEEGMWFAIALNDLGNIYSLRNDLAETESLYRESLEAAEKLAGEERFMIPVVLSNLGRTMEKRRRFDEARSFYDKALAEQRSSGKEDTLEHGNLLRMIGQFYTAKGDYETADDHYDSALKVLSERAGERHQFTLSVMYNRALNLYRQGRTEEARGLIERTLGIQQQVFPDGHYTIAQSRTLLGDILTDLGKAEEGEDQIRSALDYYSGSASASEYQLAVVRTSLGANLLAQGDRRTASGLLRQALEGFNASTATDDHEILRCRKLLAKLGGL